MTPEEEFAFLQGEYAVWCQLLRLALTHLGYDSPEATHVHWIVEREAAIAALRGICAEYGDNEWPSTLPLADILEKHLAPYLAEHS